MEYDVIGDVHGQGGKLRALLRRLGYARRAGGWVPPVGRQAVFVGDLIDRGPEQLEVLDQVRRMVDAGHARVAMGNHEFNAIAWATPRAGSGGGHLRSHTPVHAAQHAEFLRQVGEGSAAHRDWIAWFRTLRPTLDLGPIRVVHAWWHAPHVEAVDRAWPAGRPMDDDFLAAACDRGSRAWAAMEGLTKGLEVDLPDGHCFEDHGGVERRRVRLRWWLPPGATLREAAILDDARRARLPDVPVAAGEAASASPPAVHDDRPTFVGHYWLSGVPAVQTARVACLDYSAARDGPLVAYRWRGEPLLDAAGFVAAGA